MYEGNLGMQFDIEADTSAGLVWTRTPIFLFMQRIVSWELGCLCTFYSSLYLVHCHPLCGGGLSITSIVA